MSLRMSALAAGATVVTDNQKTTITDKLTQGLSFPLTGDALDVITLPEARYVAGCYFTGGFALGCIAEREKIKRNNPGIRMHKPVLGIY